MPIALSRFLIVVYMFLLYTSVHAADEPNYAREQRLAAEIVDAIVIGDAVDLNDGERDFLGIMTEADDEPAKGAVLILHGRGYHPAWPTVIQPLRTLLPESGWATLSIQMPVLEKDAKYFDYVPLFSGSHGRIEAGLEYLKGEGYKNVVVLAHSCGAHMAMSYINQHGDKKFNAYVGVGQGATDYKQPMIEHFPFAEMKVPVLDIYGSNDFPAVLRMADDRKKLMDKAGNKKSTQKIVKDADHYYKKAGNVEKLGEDIIEWLGQLPKP